MVPEPKPTTVKPLPPLTRATTLPSIIPQTVHSPHDRSHLAPEDAIYAISPPRKQSAAVSRLQQEARVEAAGNRELSRPRRRSRHKDGHRASSRRRKGTWKKLLWVKQSYPDNYTDRNTFLEHLQRNPRLQPYDFWPLVANSTVIVQHICSVIIFVVCFVLIFQERVSPVSVVSWGTIGTVLGWLLWDWWVVHGMNMTAPETGKGDKASRRKDQAEASGGSSTSVNTTPKEEVKGLGLALPTDTSARHSHSASASSLYSTPDINSSHGLFNGSTHHLPASPRAISHRNQQRLATVKSALLIYSALLGLSPILKSLTKSTSSDSIWAMSCWLMIINVFFFDYGGGVGAHFPASLSTNAALMASTVLASRLPSTEHVFSLTLFSIEVFGLFPVFRRHLRHVSWRSHIALTFSLVTGAGGGVGVIVSGGGWKEALVGIILGNMLLGLAMGGSAWWLISLQKYKNEIHGPWDPARPIIRRQWDDY